MRQRTRSSRFEFTELRPALSPEPSVGLLVPFLLSSLSITARTVPTNIRTRLTARNGFYGDAPMRQQDDCHVNDGLQHQWSQELGRCSVVSQLEPTFSKCEFLKCERLTVGRGGAL